MTARGEIPEETWQEWLARQRKHKPEPPKQEQQEDDRRDYVPYQIL